MRRVPVFGVLAGLGLVVLSACATIRVGADFETGVRFDKYQTFGWDERDALPVGDPRLDNNPFFDSRVRGAVELELAAKGLRLVTSSPDLLIHYHASVQRRIDVVARDRDRGYTSMDYDGRGELVEFEEGTIIVDVADAATRKILWRGWAQTDVEGLVERPREMEKRVSESMKRLMQNFPRTP